MNAAKVKKGIFVKPHKACRLEKDPAFDIVLVGN